MIEKMKKVLFIGPDNTKEIMLHDLQRLGILQIEPYTGDSIEKEDATIDTSRADKIAAVLKILKQHTPEKDIDQKAGATYDTAEEIASLDRRLQQLREEEKALKSKHDILCQWGSFSMSDLNYIEETGGVIIQFWDVPARIADTLSVPEAESLLVVSKTPQVVKFISFAENRLQIENCTETRIDTDLNSVESELIENSQARREIEQQITDMNCFTEGLRKLYLGEINQINFSEALGGSVRPLGILFAFQGWVPARKLSRVAECAQRHNGKLFEIEPDRGETIPTLMKNNGIPAMGQDLVLFYDTPATSDWDPSSVIFLSFIVFFAMILGDGGYGMTLFLLLLFLRIKNRKSKPAIRRFMNMGLILTFGTVIYGLMSGGFFGFSSQTPLVGKIIDLQLFNSGSLKKEDINFNMQLSIIVGMVHISISVFLKALRQFAQRNILQPFSNFAWIVAIWTFFFWYAGPKWGIPGQDPRQIQIMLGCAGVIFLTSAGTLHPGRLIFGGLGGLYNGVQFFSDILSYIRIFALGLSGALIAQTFNSIAGSIMQVGVWAIPLGILIFLFGHLLNIALCIMGAVIHGLRLNFLEYFRWSFDGGGKVFRPLEDLLEKNL